MPRAAPRSLSIISICVLAAVIAGCNLSTDDLSEPRPGDSCDEEGETSGSLVCEDGVWVKDDGELDAGFDVGDAGPTEDADTGCEPETDAEFCERLGVECGEFVGIDNCGDARSVDCGAEGFDCGEMGTCLLADSIDALDTNACDCPDVDFESGAGEICDEVGAECGEFAPGDECVLWEGEDPVSCGECPDGADCGLAGPNVCGCPCEIDGECQNDGDQAPGNACLICDPGESTAEFTPVDDGTACGDNAICQGGECICDEAAGFEECGGECVDVDNNPDHCGDCGVSCGPDEVCDNGSCETDCPSGLSECSGSCVDTDSDDDHCGGCNEACPSWQVCDGGVCSADCSSGETECSGLCVDTDSDPDHCGQCNSPCDVAETCDQGVCVSACSGDEVECGGQCVDTDSDPGHCGGCEEACPDGDVCDGGECLECVDSGDCDGAGQCHEQHPVCIDECCDFVAEDVFTDVPYSHDRFDIDVTDEGDPVIVFLDTDTDVMRIAERIGGNWYTQMVSDLEGSTTLSDVRIDLDGDGDPHIVLRTGNGWTYHWREGSTWMEEDVWDEDPGNSGTDIAVDDDGYIHIMGTGASFDSHEVYYAKRSPQGDWLREITEFDEDVNLNWEALDLTSDGEPVVSLTVWDGDNSIWLARRDGGFWEHEFVIDDTSQVHDMAVGADDEVLVVSIAGGGTPHNGIELSRDGGGSWQTTAVNSQEYAFNVYVVADDLGDPHISFNDNEDGDGDRHLGYTRFDGTDWESHALGEPEIERSFWQRVAVDGDRRAHFAVYDSNRNTITYVMVE